MTDQRETCVCVVGGGPAGIVPGYLLGRCEIQALVLESQSDFDRDFRGDTLHAGVLEIFDFIGLAEIQKRREPSTSRMQAIRKIAGRQMVRAIASDALPETRVPFLLKLVPGIRSIFRGSSRWEEGEHDAVFTNISSRNRLLSSAGRAKHEAGEKITRRNFFRHAGQRLCNRSRPRRFP